MIVYDTIWYYVMLYVPVKNYPFLYWCILDMELLPYFQPMFPLSSETHSHNIETPNPIETSQANSLFNTFQSTILSSNPNLTQSPPEP